MFNHSPVLFVQDDGSSMEFYMQPCKSKDEIKPLIEYGGGILQNSAGPNVVRLVESGCKLVNVSDDETVVSVQYIYDCVKVNGILDFKDYHVELMSDIDKDEMQSCLAKYETKPISECRSKLVSGVSKPLFEEASKSISENVSKPMSKESELTLEKPSEFKKNRKRSLRNPHYTESENKTILTFVRNNIDLYNKMSIRAFAGLMIRKGVVQRTQAGMKLYFIRHSYIFKKPLTQKDIDNIISQNHVGPEFNLADEMKMIAYVIENDYFHRIRTLPLYTEMALSKVTKCSDEAMYSHFIGVILKHLERYDLQPEHIKKFKKNNINIQRKPYTESEHEKILAFVCNNIDLYNKMTRKAFVDLMIRKGIVQRSKKAMWLYFNWRSYLFKKPLTEKDIDNIASQIHVRPKFSLADEKKMIAYVIENDYFHRIRKLSLYTEMALSKVTKFRDKAMYNHFIRVILKHLEQYDLQPEHIRKFKKNNENIHCKVYTESEHEKILAFVRNNIDLYNKMSRKAFVDLMIRKGVVQRTKRVMCFYFAWRSYLFKKPLTEKDIDNIALQIHVKQKFSLADEMKMIDYVIENDYFHRIRKLTLYTEMVLSKVTKYSDKAMHNHFIGVILKHLERYDLQPEHIKKFKKNDINILCKKSASKGAKISQKEMVDCVASQNTESRYFMSGKSFQLHRNKASTSQNELHDPISSRLRDRAHKEIKDLQLSDDISEQSDTADEQSFESSYSEDGDYDVDETFEESSVEEEAATLLSANNSLKSCAELVTYNRNMYEPSKCSQKVVSVKESKLASKSVIQRYEESSEDDFESTLIKKPRKDMKLCDYRQFSLTFSDTTSNHIPGGQITDQNTVSIPSNKLNVQQDNAGFGSSNENSSSLALGLSQEGKSHCFDSWDNCTWNSHPNKGMVSNCQLMPGILSNHVEALLNGDGISVQCNNLDQDEIIALTGNGNPKEVMIRGELIADEGPIIHISSEKDLIPSSLVTISTETFYDRTSSIVKKLANTINYMQLEVAQKDVFLKNIDHLNMLLYQQNIEDQVTDILKKQNYSVSDNAVLLKYLRLVSNKSSEEILDDAK